MSDVQKATSNGKKAKRKSLAELKKLDRGPSKSIQETFRCTEDEHNQLVDKAQKEKFNSMSDFYRAKLGLDKI